MADVPPRSGDQPDPTGARSAFGPGAGSPPPPQDYGPPGSGAGYGAPPPPGYAPPPPGYGGPGYGPPGGYDQRAPSNGLGTAALVVGIIALILAIVFFPLGLLLGIVAVVLGFLGRNKAKRGEATNKGSATAGLVTGALAVLIAGAIAAFIGNFLFDNKDELGNLTDCVQQAGDDQAAREDCARRFQDQVDPNE